MNKYLIVDVVNTENRCAALYCTGRPLASHLVEGLYHLIYCEDIAKNQKDKAYENTIAAEFMDAEDQQEEWMNYCAGLQHGDDFQLTDGARKFINGMWRTCECPEPRDVDFIDICADLKTIKDVDEKS